VDSAYFDPKLDIMAAQYYTDKSSGELRPGKKGITLNAAQWDKFLSATDALSEKLKDVESGKSEPAPAKSEKKKEGNGKTKKYVLSLQSSIQWSSDIVSLRTQKPAKKKKKADSESEDAEESDGDE